MVVETLAIALIVVVVAFVYSFSSRDVEASLELGLRPRVRR